MGSMQRAWLAVVTFAAALGAHVAASSAAEPVHTLTASDEFEIQLAADPQISPDGKRIVYVRRFADPMSDKRYSNLWIVGTDGTDHRPLTSGNENDHDP